MSWLTALAAGVCAAPFTGLIIGTAAGLSAEWLRLPNREGALGFFAVAMTIFGAFIGLLLGVLRTGVVRIASFYLQQWGGIAPLPTDPPPR